MFCKSCGSSCPDGAKFCNSCGDTLTAFVPSGPLGNSGAKVGSNVGKGVGIALAIVIVIAVFVALSNHSQDVNDKPLPCSAAAIISSYNPQPTLSSVDNTGSGNTVEYYSAKCHSIALEKHNGDLVGYTMAFDPTLADIQPDCGPIMSLRIGLFIHQAADVEWADVSSIMKQIGGGNFWSPEPNEMVVHGVRLKRYMHENKLVLQAEAD